MSELALRAFGAEARDVAQASFLLYVVVLASIPLFTEASHVPRALMLEDAIPAVAASIEVTEGHLTHIIFMEEFAVCVPLLAEPAKPKCANGCLLFPCVEELAVAAAAVSLQVELTYVRILWLKVSGRKGGNGS